MVDKLSHSVSFSLDPLHPAQSIISAVVESGFQVIDLLAFTRRSTVLTVADASGVSVLKVFFGSDHILDAMDAGDRVRAYGFYWYALKTDAERQFEIEAVGTEIEITGKMSGLPGWPTLLSSGCANGLQYMQMQLVNGQKLVLPSRLEPASIRQRIYWLSGVADALSLLHEKDFVHRDVYQENVLVGEKSATIIDLGSAKHKDKPSGPQIRGPEVHWPPEYMKDYRNAQPTADIFGLGVMLHRALTGDIPRPFSEDLLSKFALPPIGDMVLSCLDPDPGNRPAAREISQVLSNSASALVEHIKFSI